MYTTSNTYQENEKFFLEGYRENPKSPIKKMANAYSFGFNGQEKVNEIAGTGNTLDYGARIYNSRLGKFFSTDPEEEEFPWQSPYAISSNSPIWRIDPDGEWDIEVHAHRDRATYGYATLIVKDNDGKVVYRTVVKTIGTHRVRNKTNGDTPTGTYKILEWRKTGNKRYATKSFGPNSLLALEYRGKQGKGRQGMHLHGGRGSYKGGKALMLTHGCLRINDNDIKDIKVVTDKLEKQDPTERKGNLTVSDDLKTPVKYNEDRHDDPNQPKSFKAHIIDAGDDGYTNMRANPGSGDPTKIDAGTAIEVLEQGDKFTKIKYNGNEGYVPSRYVKKD